MATQVELAIAWARKKIGTAAYSGRCQAFLADAYAYGAGMTRRSASTANAARNLWRVSTSRKNIPVGAAVYFDSPTAPAAGHVGLYIGNNQLIHPFSKVRIMSVDAVIGAGYAYRGWGWNGGVRPTGAGSAGVADTSDTGSAGALEETSVIHIPQTEQVWTKYEDDRPNKPPDSYQYLWESWETGKTRDITDRVGSPVLEDDSDSLCLQFSFSILQSSGERFMQPLKLAPGDIIAAVNTGSKETVFLGQIQSMSGSYRDRMSYTCLDGGRLLTTNDVILQFNNVPAKTALLNLANKVGIQSISCPNLISSVYDIVKDNAANIAKSILETVTAENGVPYFLRMMGGVLVVRSFGETCIRGWHRQESNLAAFDILDEASATSGSWSIDDLRNHVQVYSDADDAVTVLASAEDATSIRRYGRRTALETFSDQDKVTAASKAKTTLARLNQVTEDFSLHCYGSDRIVAGCRLRLSLEEASGEYWVTRVSHSLGPPHTMDLTLRRAT